MTEREALKLALEALENVYGKGKRCEAAIAAIKQVLAQPEQESVCGATLAGMHATIRHLSALVDEQRKLMVEVDDVFGRDAYGLKFEDGDSELIDRVRTHIEAISEPKNQEPEQEPVGTVKELFTQAAWEKHDLRGSTKVYTTPPQRTWVGLTDEQILELNFDGEFCVITDDDEQILDFARAIEAKLKQKNGYAEEKNI